MLNVRPTARATLAAAALAAALSAGDARAAVEYVTSATNCQTKVDQPNDGKNLRILAGPNVQFEVWGDAVDLGPSTGGVRLSSGTANVSMRLLRKRSALENTQRGCPFEGSALIEIDSPLDLASSVDRALIFTMPLGDESRQPITIKRFPPFNVVYAGGDVGCIVNSPSGTQVVDTQDTRTVLTLPPGHQQDSSTCAGAQLSARIDPQEDIGEIDIGSINVRYAVDGAPSFLDVVSNQTTLRAHAGLSLVIDTAAIRALANPVNATMTIRSPGRSDTLLLNVNPTLGSGFTTAARCNPSSFNSGDLTDCQISLARPAGLKGQLVTWRMTTAGCFTQAVATAPYNASASFQVFKVPAGQQVANIRVRSVNAGPCADEDGVVHTFEAWIGDFRFDPQVTAFTSGPNYTRGTIRVIRSDT
jgi:hypothetical protein